MFHILSAMYVPTERLVLRDFREQDVDAVHAYASDPAVLAFTRWSTGTWDQTVAFVNEAQRVGGPTFLAVCERGSDEPIGGISAGKSEHVQLDQGELELSWVLRRDKWGLGYATEAVSVLIEELFLDPQVQKLVAFCHPDNMAAHRVLAKVGMTFEGRRDAVPAPVAAEVFSTQLGEMASPVLDEIPVVPPAAALRFGRGRPGTFATFMP